MWRLLRASPLRACRAERLPPKLAADPTVDRSGWAGPNDPDEATAARIYEACISAFQSVVFLEGLTEAYKEYKDRCVKAGRNSGHRIICLDGFELASGGWYGADTQKLPTTLAEMPAPADAKKVSSAPDAWHGASPWA